MHKKLLIEAFEKAKKEQGLTKKIHVSKFLSDYILQDSGEPYGERILRIHYNNAFDNSNEKVELRQFAVNSLCNYLKYESFSDFIKNEPVTLKENIPNFFLKNKIKLISALGIIIVALIISTLAMDSQRWMIWVNNHYEEVEFDLKKYDANQFKIYNENRIKNFKKISPDCKTVYFKSNGNENLWYGKNKNRELEFFTSLGLHPETSKTLKPITNYMIKKYICDSYIK